MMNATNVPMIKPARSIDVEADEWCEPEDIRATRVLVPDYDFTALPKVYYDMAFAYSSFYGTSMELYAGIFSGAVCMHVPTTCKVEVRAGTLDMTNLIDFSGAVASSGSGKTPTIETCLGNKGNGPMAMWDKVNQAAFPGSKEELGVMIRQKRATAQALRDQIHANSRHGFPANQITNEAYDALEGGASHHVDSYCVISSLLLSAWDSGYDAVNTKGGGRSQADNPVLNLAFGSVPSKLLEWAGFEQAMTDGLFGRISLYTSGPTMPKVDTLDRLTLSRWYAIQERLHKMSHVHMLLERDDEVQDAIDHHVKVGGRLCDDTDPMGPWLKKMQLRHARLSAVFFLVDYVQRPDEFSSQSGLVEDNRTTILTIPSDYQRDALEHIINFSLAHQRVVLKELLHDKRMRDALMQLVRKLYVKKLTEISYDELADTKSSRIVRNYHDEVWKQRFIERAVAYEWIYPIDTRQTPIMRPDKPWEARRFAVNPLLTTAYEKYDTELREEWRVANAPLDVLRMSRKAR